jgi:hypothetical protein
MPLRFLRTVAIVLLLAATADAQDQLVPLPPRDRPLPRTTATAAIHGRVVDGDSGAAIARARVRLFSENGNGPPAAAITDESGAFSFSALGRGTYSLFVERVLYVVSRYPAAGQTMRTARKPLTVEDGQILEGITVPMFHGGTIAGRVVDAHGDPVEGAPVQLLRVSRSGRALTPGRGFAQTNDLGEFRIAHLDPARYVVLVTPRSDWMLDASGAPETQPSPTFYPGVPSIDQAQPITLERGRSATGVDFTLLEGRAATVSGTVEDENGVATPPGAGISVRTILPVLGGTVFGGTGTNVRPDGTFTLRLAPGEYELEAHARPIAKSGDRPSESTELFGSVRISVGGDLSGIVIRIGSGASASGRIVFDGASPLPVIRASVGSIWVVRQSREGGGCRQGHIDLAPDFTFTVDGLFGSCVASMTGPFGPWFVKSVTYEGTEWLDRSVTFSTGQRLRDVQVILTDRTTEAVFEVVDERGQTTRDFVGLLFPVDRARWTDDSRFIREFVPARSSMRSAGPGAGDRRPARPDTIRGLPPGEYFAVAVEDIDPELSHDPDALEKLSHAATRVMLVDGLSIPVRLRRIGWPD